MELFGEETSFWSGVEDSSPKLDILQTAVQHAGLLRMPGRRFNNWIANLDTPSRKKVDSEQVVPVGKPAVYLPKKEDMM